MAFVQFSKVSLAFGDRDILKDVSLNLASGSRAALAGANGAGKSTLMKVIAGRIQSDSGDRAVQKGCRISYLPQSGIVHKGKTLKEEAETAYESITALIARMEELGRMLEELPPEPEELAGKPGKDSGDFNRGGSGRIRVLLEEHHRLQEEIENSGYYRREAIVDQVIAGLGFSRQDMNRDTDEFSGGWQMRIALAKILLENPDIMLLDEPTNYLDIEARAWLESWLRSFPGGCLVVSHDRYFLDVTVNEVYEIFQGSLKRYAGNYSVYEKLRTTELEGLVKRYEAQQQEIEKTEALIRRFRYKATKAAFAQDLIKRLDKMERIEIPENLKRINITIPPPPHSGRIALILEGIGKSYGTMRVLSNLELILETQERLLVAGPNGAGKTTLLIIIAGVDAEYSGNVKYGTGISVGYFSQDEAERLSGSKTVEKYIEDEAPAYLIPRVRDMLGAFLFRGDDVYKPLSVLSGGEKSRLALLRMLLKPINLLVLDEPTNHLDLQSKDLLLECLKAYKGTVIFVSHDRQFMEALSTKTLELFPGRQHRLFYGNYAYYLDRIEREASGEMSPVFPSMPVSERRVSAGAGGQPPPGEALLNAAAPRAAEEAASAQGAGTVLPRTILIKAAERREQEKQRQAVIRRLRRKEEFILGQLEKLETEKMELETELGKPEVYSSGEKARAVKIKLDVIAAALEAKINEWETLSTELEAAENSNFTTGN